MYLINRIIKIILKGGEDPRKTSDDSICNEGKTWNETHAYNLCGLGHHSRATRMQAMKSINTDLANLDREPNVPRQ